MVKIRLRRVGAKKAPFTEWSSQIPVIRVTADSLKRSARIIPMTEPSTINIDGERAVQWIKNGAQPTDTVKVLLKRAGII